MLSNRWSALLFLSLLFTGSAGAAVVWDDSEADRDARHAVFFDVGVELPQGVRLEKTTSKAGKPEYALSIIVGNRPARRIPITRKIYLERYLALRSLTLGTEPASATECRVGFRILKASERNPTWSTSICVGALSDPERRRANQWYAKTLSIIQRSSF